MCAIVCEHAFGFKGGVSLLAGQMGSNWRFVELQRVHMAFPIHHCKKEKCTLTLIPYWGVDLNGARVCCPSFQSGATVRAALECSLHYDAETLMVV